MVSSKFKKQFEELVARSVKPLADIGLTPNTITVFGLLVSLLSAWFYIKYNTGSNLLIAGLLVLFSGFLDAIDGVVARTTRKVTVFGGFLDSVFDRYSDAVVLAAITASGLCDLYVGLATIIGSIMVSYTRAKSESLGINMASVGLAERAERMIILSLFTVASTYNVEFLKYGIIILGVLAHLTVIQRILFFKKKTA